MIFALISGSESYGGGIRGIIKNSPNMLPWLVLLIPVIIAWKSERIGGILVFLLGLVLVYFFNTGPNLFVSTLIATSLIPLMGLSLWIIAIKKNR